MQEETVSTTLLKLYCTHRRFFYLDYFQNFKLFASWLGSATGSTLEAGTEYVGAQLPWYRANWEVQELAKILKCTELEVLGTIEDINNDY